MMPEAVDDQGGEAVLEVTCRFSASSQQRLEPVLRVLEARVRAHRESWGARAGAIDLVTALELAVGFAVTVAINPILTEYFKGLFNAEALKDLGREHRLAAERWGTRVREDLLRTIRDVTDVLGSQPVSLGLEEPEGAVALVFEFVPCRCYVVLNHTGMTEALAADLPDAVLRVMEYLWAEGVPGDAICVQLYFDESSQSWSYLFIPTNRGFGRFIDRYVDLRTHEMHMIPSRAAFIQKFQPSVCDGYKFLIDPYTPERC